MNMPRKIGAANMSQETRVAILEEIAKNTNDSLKEIKVSLRSLDDSMRQGFARVDQDMKQGFARVDQDMKQGFAKADQRFEKVDQEMKQGFRDVNNRMWTNFIWTITGFVSILALIAHVFHWV